VLGDTIGSNHGESRSAMRISAALRPRNRELAQTELAARECHPAAARRANFGIGTLGPFHLMLGTNEQFFGLIGQIPRRDQVYLTDIGLMVMWEKQRTNTLLPQPQSKGPISIGSAN
jgi:hypothetical protein